MEFLKKALKIDKGSTADKAKARQKYLRYKEDAAVKGKKALSYEQWEKQYRKGD